MGKTMSAFAEAVTGQPEMWMVSESAPPFDKLSDSSFLGRAIESLDEQSLIGHHECGSAHRIRRVGRILRLPGSEG